MIELSITLFAWAMLYATYRYFNLEDTKRVDTLHIETRRAETAPQHLAEIDKRITELHAQVQSLKMRAGK